MAFEGVLPRAEQLYNTVSSSLNKVVIVLVIILIGFILGKIVESMLRYLFAHIELDDRLTKAFGVKRNYARAIRRSIVRLIYFFTVILALDKLSLVSPVFELVTFLAVIVIIISMVIAGMDVVPNLLARAALQHKRIKVGDEVFVSDPAGQIQGTIVDISLTDVHVKRRNGDLFFIPIATFLNETIVKKRR